jgi:hypothetical protein
MGMIAEAIKRNARDVCVFAAGEHEMQCFNIDYYPREEYSPDPNDSTMAIPCE